MRKTYGDLVEALSANENYRRANEIWSDESRMLDAVMEGRKFLGRNVNEMEIAEFLEDLTPGEKSMYQLGALAAWQDTMDMVPMTRDATKQFLEVSGNQKKLARVFGSKKKADEFLDVARREREFVLTNRVVAGGSPTSQNVAGQRWLSDSAIQPESFGLVGSDPVTMALGIASQVMRKRDLSPETLSEIQQLLMNRGLTSSQVREVFQSPRFQMALSRNPLGARGAMGALGAGGPIVLQQGQ